MNHPCVIHPPTGLVAIVLLGSLASAGCGGEKPAQAAAPTSVEGKSAVPEPKALTPEPPPEKTPLETVAELESLQDAIAFSRPFMSDTVGDLSPGALLLGRWAVDALSWEDLEAIPETRQALVMKDPEEERGRKICARGKLIEIRAERTSVGKFFHGGIFNGGYRNIVRFMAVGSTGELVENRRGAFCGIVVGTQSYANSAGGTTHTTYAVGMFDLPENRREL